jgi:hypothetical protein
MENVMQNPKNKPGNVLMDALDFDENDLLANRNGQLGESQYDDLHSQRIQFLAASVAVFLLIVFFMIFVLVFGNTFMPGLVMLIIGGAFAMVAYLYSHKLKFDRDIQGVVELLEGVVELDIIQETCALDIDDCRFYVSSKVFLAFKNGDPYRIYFTCRTRKILSAEWLYDVQN